MAARSGMLRPSVQAMITGRFDNSLAERKFFSNYGSSERALRADMTAQGSWRLYEKLTRIQRSYAGVATTE